ncbi:MAG TPA: TIM-barrel domain-containing protein, partial [Vicinamibacterales bacterium]|nr:TIM-barrel domain-containing protein [Vicinamibacterales bacterium]
DAPSRGPLPLDLFIVGSRDPIAIMSEYARLTGMPELPPLWSFGYQQSHRTLASREEILDEARTFRAKKLPCETLIYLGTGFCPSGWNTDNGEFTFNPKVFPDPKAMIDELHADHFKVVLHVVVEARTMTGTVADRCAAAPLPSGKTPDGKWPDDRQVACYWPAHKPLFDVGVDGFWPDQGDGLDAASRLARNRMYWDGPRSYRPNERPFALNRNGGAGMQRFGSFLWSGDVYSTWETLKTHVPVAINSALSGIPFWGTDIGGFVPTKEFTGELYVRWFQFGAFCPLFRAHGRTWKLRLPWGWNTGSLEPDEIASYTGGAADPDPGELHNAAVEPICRTYLELRSRLMPYLYTAVREAHDTGLPILRAMWLHYPDDDRAIASGDQYLWGGDMLVAPVVERGATTRRVYLPAGVWYDFWSNERHDGEREITRAVDLATMPLFVRAGAILPLGPVKQYTAEPVDEPLTLQVHPGADGAFTLYEDDGASFAYERGDFMRVAMQWDDRQRRLTLRLADGSRMRGPARSIRVQIAGAQTTRDAVFDGKPIEVRL